MSPKKQSTPVLAAPCSTFHQTGANKCSTVGGSAAILRRLGAVGRKRMPIKNLRSLLLSGLFLSVLPACGGGDENLGDGDFRIDHAGSVNFPVEANAPRTCQDGQGRIHVVWYDARQEFNAVYYNRSANGGALWNIQDLQLNTPEGTGDAVVPDIACMGDRIYVAWEDHRDGELENGNIYFNYSEDGGETFQVADIALDADEDGDYMSLEPRIFAVGSSVYVTWFDSRYGAYDIFLNASTDGGATWLPEPVRVDSGDAGSAYSAHPVLAADENGNVIVAWEDSRDGYSDIYVNHSSDYGHSFGVDQRLDIGAPGSADSFLPAIEMSEGYGYIAWHDTASGQGRDIYLSRSTDSGASWTSGERTESSAAGLFDALFPALVAVGPELHMVWQDDRSGGHDIFYRRSQDAGVNWDMEEFRLDRDASGSSQSYRPQVRRFDDGHVVAFWEDYRYDGTMVGFNDLLYNYSTDNGDSWSGADYRVNSNKPGSAYTIDPWMGRSGGELFFVWADGRFGSSNIFFNALLMGESSVYVAPSE